MPSSKFGFATFIMILLCLQLTCYAQPARADSAIIASSASALQRLGSIQQEVRDLHPYLEKLYPVAVAENGSLYIFDIDSVSGDYRFQKQAPQPFPISRGVRAAFPLESYNWQPVCVVSPDAFDDLNGYLVMFHEFMHCAQFHSGEFPLKQTLEINRIAMEKQDFSWELNHPFPYGDSLFTAVYGQFLEALAANDSAAVRHARRALKKHLDPLDYEYMVWEEWKEGFARLIENRLQAKYGIAPNHGGKETPFNRVSFYYGGAKFIQYLAAGDRDLFFDNQGLFERMRQFGD